MSFSSILIGVALLLATIPIVAGPLIRKKRLKSVDLIELPPGSRESYQQTLLVLRDLDFDHQLGVVAEADYQQLRAQLLAEAAQAYEQTTPDQENLEQLIETAVLDRRQHIGSGHSRCSSCSADLDPADKYCAACGAKAGSVCPHCNQFVEGDDKFCAYCGTQLAITVGVEV